MTFLDISKDVFSSRKPFFFSLQDRKLTLSQAHHCPGFPILHPPSSSFSASPPCPQHPRPWGLSENKAACPQWRTRAHLREPGSPQVGGPRIHVWKLSLGRGGISTVAWCLSVRGLDTSEVKTVLSGPALSGHESSCVSKTYTHVLKYKRGRDEARGSGAWRGGQPRSPRDPASVRSCSPPRTPEDTRATQSQHWAGLEAHPGCRENRAPLPRSAPSRERAQASPATGGLSRGNGADIFICKCEI